MLLPCVWLSTSLYFFTLQWYIVKLTLGFISLRPWQTANRLKCGLKSELNWETLIFTSVMWTVWFWVRSVFHILGVAPLTGPVAKTPQLSEDQGQQTTVGRVLLDNTHFSKLFTIHSDFLWMEKQWRFWKAWLKCTCGWLSNLWGYKMSHRIFTTKQAQTSSRPLAFHQNILECLRSISALLIALQPLIIILVNASALMSHITASFSLFQQI